MKRYMDIGSLIVALVTLLLFIAALFAKGVTHDLFLESGVFLVSVKVIIMSHKNNVAAHESNEKLDRVLAMLERKGS